MPTPEELAIIESSAPKAEPTVNLTKDGQTVAVPESKRNDYLVDGYEDPEFAEGGKYNPTLSGIGENVLARGEALDRGATFGAGGLLGSVGAAAVDQLTAPDQVDANGKPIDKSFGQSFHEAEDERRRRAEALGAEGLAWELAGGIATGGASLLAKGGAKGAAALLAHAPAALAEQIGTKAAAKVLGTEAAELAGAGLLKTMKGRALGGLAEGAVSGAASTAVENVDLALQDPKAAAQNILVGTTVGGAMGGVLGGGFGLVEGASRAAGQRLAGVEAAAAPRPAVPTPVDITPDAAINANVTRPMTAAQIPDPERSMARKALDYHRAMTGGETEAVDEGARSLQRGLDETELLEMEARERLGIAQKRKVNEVALQNGFADDVVGVAPEDAMHFQTTRDMADHASRQVEEFRPQLDDVRTRHQAALDGEAAARKALDDAESGRVSDMVPAAVRKEDLSDIVHNTAQSRDVGGAMRAEKFEMGNDGGFQINTGEHAGLATIGRIKTPDGMERQGIGTRLYAKADEYARSKGLKLASDTDRSPAAEGWWKKQVEAGRAEFLPKKNRYVLNHPLTEPFDRAAKLAAPAPKLPVELADITANPRMSKVLDNGLAYDTFELPQGRGAITIDTGSLKDGFKATGGFSGPPAGYATVNKVEVSPNFKGQGYGTALYTKADEFARSKGLKLASDLELTPDAEVWWKGQVAKGNAEYSDEMGRYVLNRPASTLPTPAATEGVAAAAKKLSGKELKPLREALKDAQRNTKAIQKEYDNVMAGHTTRQQAAESAQLRAFDAPAPRPMTRLESEARGMYQGLFDSINQFKQTVAGAEADAVNNFEKRVMSHYQKTLEAFGRGDFGTAHNLMDQGLKGSLEDLIKGAKSGAVQEYGKELYKVPQSFLENGKVWGTDIAGRNALANPTWHNNIVASNDAGYKGMFMQVGEDGYQNWGNRRGANSAAAGSLMRQIGEQQAESTEVGVRRALRAKVDDYKNRNIAWGDEASADIPARMAKIQTHVEDTLDNTALFRRDAANGRQGITNLTAGATTGALLGAVTGTPAVGIPFVAARWLLGSVAKYRGDLIQRTVNGAVKLVQSGAKMGEGVGRVGNQAFGRRMGAMQRREALNESGNSRQKAIAEVNALQDVKSPQFGALAAEAEKTNAISPGLGDAIMQHKLQTVQYIQSKMPTAPSPAVFSPAPRLTTAAATSLDRILIATGHPAKTFERITDGAATPEDLDAMRTLFPGPYAALTKSIVDEVTKNPRRVRSVSTQMYLSRIVGQPLTPALMTIAQSQERAKKATQSAEDQGAPQDGGDGKTARANLTLDPNDVYGSRADRIMSE